MDIDGISFGMQHADRRRMHRRRIRPQTDAGKRLTVALLLMMQRTKWTADAELMPLEGVRGTLMAFPSACSTQTADGCTAAEFDRRQMQASG
mgnify:CR=1 FL=1